MLADAKTRLGKYTDLSREDRIDAICDCFEDDWKRGERPEVSAYLELCAGAEQPQLLKELLLLDWELRSNNGDCPSWDEYLTKLPQFSEQIEAARFQRDVQNSQEPQNGSDYKSLTRIAHFELLEKIGSGAAGDVWKARDTLLARFVAVKIPRSIHLSDDELNRFLREGRAAGELNHPHIVAVHEVGCADGTAYIVSDFVAGQDLRGWLKRSRPTFRQSAEVCHKIADALAHAHRHGVVHRDLKPANVLLDANESPHIVDFGLAKRLSSQASISTQCQLIGTPAYMSPEQARGAPADPRSDVYSLGIMLYEMLAGHPPFAGSLEDVICSVLTKEPPNPRGLNRAIPRDLELICLKAIAKRAIDRYQTADEIREDLDAYLHGIPIRACRLRKIVLAWHGVRRRTSVIFFATATLIAAVFVLKGSSGQPSSAPVDVRRSIALTTKPASATVVFVPLSATDGDPVVNRAIRAPSPSPVSVVLTPGDYWVEAVLPDGRFHDVLRHVPASRERSTSMENHLRWSTNARGTVELPEISIPEKDVSKKMLFVDTSDELKTAGLEKDEYAPGIVPSFYVDAQEATLQAWLKYTPLVPLYLQRQQMQSDRAIPLTYDDAIAFAEATGRRLPTRFEWQRAQAVLPPRHQDQLADWTSTWAVVPPGVHVFSGPDQKDSQYRLVSGFKPVSPEDTIWKQDQDTRDWVGLARNRFYPLVGVLCVRATAPQFVK